ncbi:MAG: hypothetical protein AB8H79_26495 [Myxococcota bacterium]
MTRLIPIVLILAGCIKAVKPEAAASAETEALAAPPRLPAPRAGTYARVPSKAKDPIVQSVVGGRTLDASLAGAAAGLALGAAQRSGGFTRREVREASWQAGYPWPVLAMGTWSTGEAGAPPAGVTTWLAAQPADRDVGVVRARGEGRDLWVALAGKEQIHLGVIPREMAAGTPLNLPPHAGGQWRVSDGSGVYREGSLTDGINLVLDVPGEWVIQLLDPGGDLARMTIYVDEEPPPLPVLPPNNVPVSSRSAAQKRVEYLLQRARDEYRNSEFIVSPLLAQAAADAMERGIDPDVRANALAPNAELGVGATCAAASVEDCIDQLLWNPQTRRPFVDDRAWSVGTSIRWTSEKVEIFAVFAGE